MRTATLLFIFFSRLMCFAEPEVASPIRLQLWHMMIYSHREVLAELVKTFERGNPGVEVLLTYRETEELRSAFQSAAMAGGGPEIIYGPSDQVGPFQEMGLIQDLRGHFKVSDFESFDPLAVVQRKGEVLQIGDSVGNHLMLIYNKKLIKNPPTNLDELIQVAQQHTNEGSYGLVFNFTEPFFFVPWIRGFGEAFFDDLDHPQLNTPAAVRAFQLMVDFRDKYKIIPKECDYEMANSLFKEGKAAMIINGDWSWGDYDKAGLDFGIAPLPKVNETGLWPAPLVGTKGYSINKNLQDREKINWSVKLIEYLTGPEAGVYFAKKVGTLPSHLGARDHEFVKNNERLKISSEIMSHGWPMPITPEIRAIWDSLRGEYQAVLAGTRSPEQAAANAQSKSLHQIRLMNQVLERDSTYKIVVLIAFTLGGWILWFLIRSILREIRSAKSVSAVRKQKLAWALSLPALLAVGAVVIYPFLFNFVLSVSNFSLKTFQDWKIVGLQNYVEVFSNHEILWVTLKTLLWTTINLFFHVGLGVSLALIINQSLPAKKIFRVLLIVPWAIPQYISALTWRGLFNQEYGSVNLFLESFLGLSPVQWLTQPWTALSACIVTNVWLGYPFMMVVALGALQAIPQGLYEAARIDGANAWQRFWALTWPMILPVMRPAVVLGTIWTFNNLNVIWLVSNGGEPGDQTHILVSYVYKSAFNLYRYSGAAAQSVLIFFVLVLFGIWTLRARE